MDPAMAAIMIFFLVITLIISGVVLLYPLSRRVGVLLESRLQEKNGPSALTESEVRRLRAAVEGLEVQLRSVSDRQEFLEKILDSRRREQLLPPGDPIERVPVQ
jgi:hypothetical protein